MKAFGARRVVGASVVLFAGCSSTDTAGTSKLVVSLAS